MFLSWADTGLARLGRTASPPGLQAQQPGPGPGNRSSLRALPARGGGDARAPTDSHPTAIIARGAHQNAASAAPPRNPNFISPLPFSLNPRRQPANERRQREEGIAFPPEPSCRRRWAAPLRPPSPERVVPALASTRLRRAALGGAS